MLMFKVSPGTYDVLCLVFGVWTVEGWADSVERLLVDPHEGPRLVGLAFVVDAAEFIAELAVLPLVVVIVFRLPDCLKRSCFVKLDRKKIIVTSNAAKKMVLVTIFTNSKTWTLHIHQFRVPIKCKCVKKLIAVNPNTSHCFTGGIFQWKILHMDADPLLKHL